MTHHIGTMVARTPVLAAVMAWTSPVEVHGQPLLRVDATALADEAVTLSGRAIATRVIAAPVASPPVSLWEATRGLVSGEERDDARQVAVELERVYRALTPATVSAPTSRR